MDKEEGLYRNCVVGIVYRPESKLVLVGKRSDKNTWQFPQGGIEKGERPEIAVLRELQEEIGTLENGIKIVKTTGKWYYYDFPSELEGKSWITKKFKGQRQMWFLCELIGENNPDLSKATDKEFIELSWFTPSQVLDEIVDFKKETYVNAMKDLGLINL